MQNDKKFWSLVICVSGDDVVRMIYLSQECPKINESFALKFPPHSGIILEAKELPLSEFERGLVTRFCFISTLHEEQRWYSNIPWFDNWCRLQGEKV